MEFVRLTENNEQTFGKDVVGRPSYSPDQARSLSKGRFPLQPNSAETYRMSLFLVGHSRLCQ